MDLALTNTLILRNILSKLDPPDVITLFQVNRQLRKIGQDESFYREYFQNKKRPVPPSVNLARYYFDDHSYSGQASNLVKYLQYSWYAKENFIFSDLEISTKMMTRIDITLFEGFGYNQMITAFLNEQNVYGSIGITTINGNEFNISLNRDVGFGDDFLMTRDQLQKFITRCLSRHIRFRCNGQRIELP